MQFRLSDVHCSVAICWSLGVDCAFKLAQPSFGNMNKKRAVCPQGLQVHPQQHFILSQVIPYLFLHQPIPLKLPQSVVTFAMDDLCNARLLSQVELVCKSWKYDVDNSTLWKAVWEIWYALYKKANKNSSIYIEHLFGQTYLFYPDQFRRNLESYDPFIMSKPVQGWLRDKLPPVLRLFHPVAVTLADNAEYVIRGHKEALRVVITRSCCSCRECPDMQTSVSPYNGDILCGNESDERFSAQEAVLQKRRKRSRPGRKAAFKGSYAEVTCREEQCIQGLEDFREGKSWI